MLKSGSTIGILGGGQLGRMLAMSAAQLGLRVHIYAPDEDSVAAEVAARFTCAAWDDSAALTAFATLPFAKQLKCVNSALEDDDAAKLALYAPAFLARFSQSRPAGIEPRREQLFFGDRA